MSSHASLTKSALAGHNFSSSAVGRSPVASSAASEAETDAETMSNAPSSASGCSDEIGGINPGIQKLREDPSRIREIFIKKEKAKSELNTAIATAVAKHQREDPLDGARSYCSMCNINPSEYLCGHCGRLSFCTKCCLNLHDNKYLSGHTFQIIDSIPPGEQCSLDDIKKKKLARDEEERASRKLLQSTTVLRSSNDTTQLTDQAVQRLTAKTQAQLNITQQAVNSSANASNNIDMASLTADKSVINVRLRELKTCLEAGQQLHKELAQERNSTKESTSTAVEAVKRRFDVLRQLINAKENQFVAVVEQAGKERSDLATAATCSINIATSELDGFISHMLLQMDRLEENKVQFNAHRQGMLDSTYTTLSTVDGWIHDHQSRLQEIRSMSLGVHVPIDAAAEAIQGIEPPKYLSYRSTEDGRRDIMSIQEASTVPVGEILSPAKAPHAPAIPATKFVEAPGVKVVVQTQIKRAPSNSLPNTSRSSPLRTTVSEGRKLHTVEQQELRNTPMRDVIRPQWGTLQQQQAPVVARRAVSPLRNSSVSSAMANVSQITAPNVSNVHTIPTGVVSRNGTPTRRVVYGRSDSVASNSNSITGASGGVPSYGRPNASSAAKFSDPYAQRVVSAAIKATVSRAQSPSGTTQRFTTSPHRSTTSPAQTSGTSSFALPTAVRRGTSPMRTGAVLQNTSASAIVTNRGKGDNSGGNNVPVSNFAVRKTTSPQRR